MITKAFNNDDYAKLKMDLEDGIFSEDMFDEGKNEDEFELLPRVMFDVKRPHHAILKEFGWMWILPLMTLIFNTTL